VRIRTDTKSILIILMLLSAAYSISPRSQIIAAHPKLGQISFVQHAPHAGAQPAQVVVQAPPTPTTPPAKDRHIVLDVVVTDHAGNPIHGLKQGDFTVLDDKQPQAITSFREAAGVGPNADPPFQAVVVVDSVNNTYHHLEVERTMLAKFLNQTGELPLPTSLDCVTAKSQKQTDPTRDGKALTKSLDSANGGLHAPIRSQGIYGAVERSDLSQRYLQELVTPEAKLPGRKLVIWLGPAWPYLSGPDITMDTKEQKILFKDIVWMSTMLRQARITLYSVDTPEELGESFYYEQFLKGVSSYKAVRPGIFTLQVLAVQSGGQVLNRSNDLGDSISRCLRDAQLYYTLAFNPPPASAADQYHNLQVKVGKTGMIVRTRTGYYAQP
jgi:VWFA-related protein